MEIENNQLYLIKEGETLASIADKFNLNPTSILIINNITPKYIRKGFVLYIPNKKTTY